jgi:glycosyltransferase involved in cell wall biosynthesis
MRLLNVLHSANPAGGGVIEAVLQMSRAHQRQGHIVEIASLDAPDAPWVRKSSFPIWALGPGVARYAYTPQLVALLRRHRHDYDAVIINGLWQFSSFGVRQALHGTTTPYVVFPHGMLDPWFQQNYPLKHLKKCLYWRFGEYRVLRDARAVLFTSDEERRLARKSFRPYHCRELVTTLGTSAPPAEVASQRALFFARFPHLQGKRLLLFLGRLHEKKGCDLLIRAFARARAEVAQSSDSGELHLVMAGPPSDKAYLQELKTTAGFFFPGEEPPITWTGMIGGDLKWGAYRAAEAFVLPSHQENFGFSVVEALACELPVLISDKVNIWREIEADRAGLVESDDLEGTVRLLRGWISMAAEFRQQMRLSALRCFLARFEVEFAAANFIDLLQDVIRPSEETAWPPPPDVVGTKP